MADPAPSRLVSRRPGSFSFNQGVSPQLWLVPSKPPGPWIRRSSGDVRELWDLPAISYSPGSLVAVKQGTSRLDSYVEMYVYVANPYDQLSEADLYWGWEYWKRVDLDWPKIDPNTGRPYDQFLDWYSPLAE